MKRVIIDCAAIPDKVAMHRALAEALAFPDYYGNNLDALYDCLSDIREETSLTLLHFTDMGNFRAGFQAVLEEVEQENLHLIVTIS